jgi:hypothetical protein
VYISDLIRGVSRSSALCGAVSPLAMLPAPPRPKMARRDDEELRRPVCASVGGTALISEVLLRSRRGIVFCGVVPL